MRFAVVIEKAGNNYSAYIPNLPGCIATGGTIEETKQEIRELREGVAASQAALDRERETLASLDTRIAAAEAAVAGVTAEQHSREKSIVGLELQLAGAGEALGLSQPAISQNVRALEEAAGVPLLFRVGKTTRPTPAGEMLLQCARQVLERVDITKRLLAEHAAHAHRRIERGAVDRTPE